MYAMYNLGNMDVKPSTVLWHCHLLFYYDKNSSNKFSTLIFYLRKPNEKGEIILRKEIRNHSKKLMISFTGVKKTLGSEIL